jgi:purine catabolism regulator
MPVRIADLLAAYPGRLRPMTEHCATSTAPISWVHTSEHRDPSPFLRGQELLLTTGMNLHDRAARELFVSRLHAVSAAGVGYGTGLVHHEVSRDVVAAAQRLGLPLFEIPVTLPFIEISRWVADRLYEDQYADILATAATQRELSRALLSGKGLPGLLATLYRLAHGPVAVVDLQGAVMASAPAAQAGRQTGGARVAIEVGGVVTAYLHAHPAVPRPDTLRYAADLIGLELARRQAEMFGQRRLIGQVIEDAVNHTASDDDAARRLRVHGLDPDTPCRLMVIQLSCTAEQLRSVPWALGPILGSAHRHPVTALVGENVVVVLPEDVDHAGAADDAHWHLTHLSDTVAIGVSRIRHGVRGMRISYLEAHAAARSGSGVHQMAPLSLTSLLVNNADLPLAELAQEVLGPLLDHDRDNAGALCHTLATYLANDCSAKATSERLFLHRNSLTHRLHTIERLTGRDLTGLPDRLELWLAVNALGSAHG